MTFNNQSIGDNTRGIIPILNVNNYLNKMSELNTKTENWGESGIKLEILLIKLH